MPYGLGIDLGTSCTAAAISRADITGSGAEIVALGPDPGTAGVPTVLHLADDGTALIGAAAEPLVVSDPDRVFRGFLHRVGEPLAADPQRRPEALTARLVRWVVDTVAQREGGLPQRIVLAHPVLWGPCECDLVQHALTEAGLPGVVLVPAPVAATVAHRAQVGAADGDTLAIYDLGATFSTSITRQTGDDVVLLGEPRVLADGGGGRFDELVLGRVLDELGDQVTVADLDDEAVLAEMAELLTHCVAAREALSELPEVRVPVALPGLDAEVRLTAEELETLIAPTLRATVASLRLAMSSAGVTPADIGVVLVIGGCAGSPQVAQTLTARLGRPVTVPPRPGLTVACGAALMAARPSAVTSPSAVTPPAAATSTTAAISSEAGPPPARTPRTVSAERPPRTPLAPPPPAPRLPTPPPPAPAAPARPSTALLPEATVSTPAERSPSRRPSRALVAVAAGVLATAMVAVPLTLLRAGGSGAAAPPANEQGLIGHPSSPESTAEYGGAAVPLAPGSSTAPPTTATSAAPPAAGAPTATQPTPGPPTGPVPRERLTTSTSPAPPAPTTSTPPPPSSSTPPPPTSSTPPPPSSSPPPPTTSTPPPPSSSTPPPPTSSTPPSSSVSGTPMGGEGM